MVFIIFTKAQGLSQKRFINIDDSKAWINTIGSENRKEGEPIIVFESGHGTPMDNWDSVLAASSELGAIVNYDQPDVGKSKPDDEIPLLKCSR